MAGFADTTLTNSHSSALSPMVRSRPRVTLLSRLIGTLQLWRRRLHERQALGAMSPLELSDFGASSADVYRELSRPFWRAPPPC